MNPYEIKYKKLIDLVIRKRSLEKKFMRDKYLTVQDRQSLYYLNSQIDLMINEQVKENEFKKVNNG